MAPITRANSLYTIVDGPSWTQAEANAVKLGGHLVTINDAEENLFVSNIFLKNSPWSIRAAASDIENNHWIGLSDKDNEGTYRWISGEPVTYTNWASNEPNNFNNGNQASADKSSLIVFASHSKFRRSRIFFLLLLVVQRSNAM